ncbi:MAG: redoxin domain-containing protein [Planctomycetota bacterium]
MSIRLAVLPLLLLAHALPAQVPVGRKVPDMEWETVFESDPKDMEACKGKLVLLYFLHGKYARDREEVAKLNGWYELFKNRGLLVLCVFKEGAGQLGKWVDEYKIKFPIVSGPKVYDALKVAVTPSYYLVAGDRKVLERDWGEEPSRARIESFLARHVAPLALPEDARYAAIKAAWDARHFGEVAEAIVAAKEAAGDDAEVKGVLDKAQESLTGQLRNVGTELELLEKGPDYWAAFQRFEDHGAGCGPGHRRPGRAAPAQLPQRQGHSGRDQGHRASCASSRRPTTRSR